MRFVPVKNTTAAQRRVSRKKHRRHGFAWNNGTPKEVAELTPTEHTSYTRFSGFGFVF
jgi:hypothetical protein